MCLVFSPKPAQAQVITPPGAPTATVVSATEKSATVSFQASADDGGAPVLRYEIWKTGGRVPVKTVPLNGKPVLITGLLAGVVNKFELKACNLKGCSLTPQAFEVLTAPAPPGRTQAYRDPTSNTSVIVNWPSSVSANTTHSLWYKLVSAPDVPASWSEWTPGENDVGIPNLKITGLSPTGRYHFEARATNEAGTTRGVVSIPIALSDLPGVPVLSAEKITQTSATIKWTAQFAGLTPVADYRLMLPTGKETQMKAALFQNVTSLQSGKTYVYKVRACAKKGCSEWSAPFNLNTLPGPVVLAATPDDGSALLNWVPKTGENVTGYQVEHKLASAPAWTVAPDVLNATTATVSGLTNGVAYNFRVRVINESGFTHSNTVNATPVGAPDWPTSVSVRQITKISAEVLWQPPKNTGGLAVTKYEVYRDGTKMFSPGASAKAQIIGGLTPGSENVITLKTCNSKSCSGSSPELKFVTLPAEATGVATTPGHLSMTVQWTEGVNDKINGYRVMYRKASTTTWSEWTPGTYDVSPVTITGLAMATQYNVKIVAQNSAGTSDSATVNGSTAYFVAPLSPKNVTGTSGDKQVTLTWIEASDGGSPIDEHQIAYSTDNGVTWNVLPHNGASVDGTITHTGTVIKGLSNGTTYRFRVRTHNIVDYSSWSIMSPGVKPATVPDAPASSDATPGKSKLTVTWTASPDDGGDTVIDYTATAQPGGASCVSSGSTCQITGLTPGETYTVSVRARNTAGYSLPTAATSVVVLTPYTTPDPPSNVTLSGIGDKTITANWAAPANNGWSPITSYTATAQPGGASCVSVTESCVLTGLTNGVSYTVSVRATNAAGDSLESAPSAAGTPFTNPGAPSITSQSATTNSITVSFSAPTDNGGLPITEYTLTCVSTDGGSTKTATGATSLTELTAVGTTEGKNYTCSVRASNGGAQSAESGSVGFSPVWVDTSYHHCPNGGTLNGVTCETYGITGYSCASGTLSGSSCVTTTLTGYSCASGWTLSGSTCSRQVQTGWSCPWGGLDAGNGSCIFWVEEKTTTSTTTYPASGYWDSGTSQYGYYCPNGGTLWGDTCWKTTTTTTPGYWDQYGASAVYGTESGAATPEYSTSYAAATPHYGTLYSAATKVTQGYWNGWS